jgi:sialic acid synthase
MNAREMTIGDRRVADDTEAYVIAEIGHNHEGSLERAKELFRQAAAAGAHAAKLQKRDNRKVFTQDMYDQPYLGRNSYGPTYGAHREALEFGRAEYEHLARFAADLGIHFFATAFDTASVDFLMDLDLPAIKIASGDLTNTPLLSYAAKAGKPMIISTGGASLEEVRLACRTILPINDQLAVLQCTAVYPAPPEMLHLNVIQAFRREFPSVVIGFSGHDQGPDLSSVSYGLGARVIEKHFTLDQTRPGSDHHFSLSPAELSTLVTALNRAHRALGSEVKTPLVEEAPALFKMGKKVVAAYDLPAGHVLRESDLAFKSPGDGLKPYRLNELIGRSLRQPVAMDEPLSPELSILAESVHAS